MKCKNCKQNIAIKYSKYSTGEFCCKKCARAYSTKYKRKEINKKVSNSLIGRGHDSILKKCEYCKKQITVEWKRRAQKFCSKNCQKKGRKFTDESRRKLSESSKKRCSSLEERQRMREIGRKGGFGKKGYTSKGTYYQSNLEKKCFEFLEGKDFIFEPHKNIPNSSKISDVYLPSKKLWIEIDGIDREKKKEWIGKDYEYWLEKIEIYKREKLNLVIIKTFEEFRKLI